MKVGDLVQVVREYCGGHFVQPIGVIVDHYITGGSFHVWVVHHSKTGKTRRYNTKELRVL